MPPSPLTFRRPRLWCVVSCGARLALPTAGPGSSHEIEVGAESSSSEQASSRRQRARHPPVGLFAGAREEQGGQPQFDLGGRRRSTSLKRTRSTSHKRNPAFPSLSHRRHRSSSRSSAKSHQRSRSQASRVSRSSLHSHRRHHRRHRHGAGDAARAAISGTVRINGIELADFGDAGENAMVEAALLVRHVGASRGATCTPLAVADNRGRSVEDSPLIPCPTSHLQLAPRTSKWCLHCSVARTK